MCGPHQTRPLSWAVHRADWSAEGWRPVPTWLFLLGGSVCGIAAFRLLSHQRRIRRRAIETDIRLSGLVVEVKSEELVGRWPNTAVRPPRLVVRYSWQGATREQEVLFRMGWSEKGYRPGQMVELIVDRADPDRLVLADGGAQSLDSPGAFAMIAGILAAVLAVTLLLRFLLAVF